MPHFDGIELLQWAKERNKQSKFFMITAFSQILGNRKPIDMGADDFLQKPFAPEELFNKINKLIPQKEESPTLSSQDHYCKIPIDDFISEQNPKYDIYIKLSENKFLKVIHKGGKFSEERIIKFKEKQVEHLYIRQEDFHIFVGFTNVLCRTVADKKISLAPPKIMRFVEYTGEIVMQQIFQSTLLDVNKFIDAKQFIESSIKAISNEECLMQVLDSLDAHVDSLYTHSVGVSMLSYLIAKAMGYSNSKILFNVALGGLLHDIGKKEISKEILNKPRFKLTQNEIDIYESHPLRGKIILESIKNIPTEVITITYEHHENGLGRGYPRGIDKKRINPMAQIVSVADLFIELTVRDKSQPNVYTAIEAINRIESGQEDLIDENTIEALKSLF